MPKDACVSSITQAMILSRFNGLHYAGYFILSHLYCSLMFRFYLPSLDCLSAIILRILSSVIYRISKRETSVQERHADIECGEIQ